MITFTLQVIIIIIKNIIIIIIFIIIAAPLDCQNEAAIVGTGAQRINVNEFPSFVSRSKRSIEYEFEVGTNFRDF